VNKKQKKINGLAKLSPASADERVEAGKEAAAARAEEDRPPEGVATNQTRLDEKRPLYAHASETSPSARAAFEHSKTPNWVKVRYDEKTLSIPTDTANGFYHEADDGTFVCSLIPREHALEGRTSGSFARHVATHAFVLENMKSTERGEAHGVSASGGYVILGQKACRTGGVTNTECPDVTGTEKGSGEADSFRFNPKEVSESIRNVVQDTVDAYIPSLLLHGLREGLKAIGIEIEGKTTTTTTSSAWSRDLQEAMHTEDNAFLSYVTVTTQLHDATLPVAERVRHNLEMNDPKPALHVIFPAHNLAEPICPGNILIFNPTVPHGCSAKLADHDNAHVNVMYMYLKSAVVGGNNNKIPMTAEARQRAERYSAGLKKGGSAQPHLHEDVSAAAVMDDASGGEDDDVQPANPLPDRTSSQSSDVRPSNPLPDRMSSQSSDVRLANPMPDRMSSQSSDVRLANRLLDRRSSRSSNVLPGLGLLQVTFTPTRSSTSHHRQR
jgi:hypothetical protein